MELMHYKTLKNPYTIIMIYILLSGKKWEEKEKNGVWEKIGNSSKELTGFVFQVVADLEMGYFNFTFNDKGQA